MSEKHDPNVMMACRVFDTFKDVAEKSRAGVDKGNSAETIAGAMKIILKREKRHPLPQRGRSEQGARQGRAGGLGAARQPIALELKVGMERVLDLGDCR